MPILSDILGVDNNENDSVKTDAHEALNDEADSAVYYVEVEADDANDRSDNIGPAENDEAAMLDKVADNIEADAAKAETKETTGVGDRENYIPNVVPTEMGGIITEVG